MSKLPKLSYILLSHNREQYIRAAVESAFAQDYEGELEYIFSDDCSTDRTFEILQECVAAYKGSRRVVLTQTPHNMHLAGNTNHAVSFVESDWIVRADDDDYSAVDRCSKIARAILANPSCAFVAGGVRSFTTAEDDEVRTASLTVDRSAPLYRPVTLVSLADAVSAFKPSLYSYKAWRRSVYTTFGPLDLQAYYVDDYSCYFRSFLLGGGVYLENDISVYVRTDSGNMCRGGNPEGGIYQSIVNWENFIDKYYNITYQPLQGEIEKYREYARLHYSPEQQKDAASFFLSLDDEMSRRDLWSRYWRSSTFDRLRMRRPLRQKGLFSLLRCLPLPLYASLLCLYRKICK